MSSLFHAIKHRLGAIILTFLMTWVAHVLELGWFETGALISVGLFLWMWFYMEWFVNKV